MSNNKQDDSSALVTRRREMSSDDLAALRLSSFFNSSKFSDFTIKTSDREFHVHKIVMSGQSEYFDRLFDRDWRESTNNAIELKEDDPGAVEAMIRFMYQNDYDSSGDSETRISPMHFDVSVYRVADKYGVTALKLLSKEKFDNATSKCWDMDDFPSVVADVYNTIECDELRDTVAHVSHKHVSTLLGKAKFRHVLEETNGFAADIVQLMAKGKATYRCDNCGNIWTAELFAGRHYHCLSCGAGYSDWSVYAVSPD